MTTCTNRIRPTSTEQNYSTFQNDKSLDQCESTIVNQNNDAKIWKLGFLVSFFIAILAYFHGKSDYYSISPSWIFDYNVYMPKNDDLDLSLDTSRISLIVQVAPTRPLQRLVEITSRVNRAYAREWGMDYVRYNSGRDSNDVRSCFEKIFVVKTIVDKQNKEINDSLPIWTHSRRIEYDSIILLPPDAILADLDTNIIDTILPTNKLVAIAGWDDEKMTLSSISEIIVLNMKHKYTDKVIQAWWEMVKPEKQTCGANNAFGLLLTAVASVMNKNESLNDVIEPLGESSNGFVGNGDHLIKSIVPSVPGSRATFLAKNMEENELYLQNTADSVCYRFYPKCEVY